MDFGLPCLAFSITLPFSWSILTDIFRAFTTALDQGSRADHTGQLFNHHVIWGEIKTFFKECHCKVIESHTVLFQVKPLCCLVWYTKKSVLYSLEHFYSELLWLAHKLLWYRALFPLVFSQAGEKHNPKKHKKNFSWILQVFSSFPKIFLSFSGLF